MSTAAGAPVVTDDFIAQLDTATATNATQDAAITAAEAAIELLFTRFQADTKTDTTSAGGDLSVTFAVPFVATPTIVVSPHGYTFGSFTCAAFDKSTTGFTIRCIDMAGNPIVSTAVSVEWIATVA